MSILPISTSGKDRSSVNLSAPLLLALLFLVLSTVAINPTASAQATTVAEIGSGMLNSNGNTAPRNVRLDFDPLTTGTHTIRVAWPGSANFRFSVFEANSGDRIAITDSGTNPAEWTGQLDGSTEYELFIFAVSGAGTYTATIETQAPTTQPGSANEIGSGMLNRNGTTAPRNVRLNFDALTTGTHTIRVAWPGSANLRFSVFETNSGNRIAQTASGMNPAEWTGELDGSTAYNLFIFAVSGAATYTATIETEGAAPTTPLSITAQPTNVTANEQEFVDFSVRAEGRGPLSYQWFANGSTIAGATDATLTIRATLAIAGTTYSVRVTDRDNNRITSNSASLTVIEDGPPDVAPGTPVTVVDLGSGTLDSERAAGPRFINFNFDSLGDLVHTITVAWSGNADVRFNLLDPNGDRINSSGIQGRNPGVFSAELEANTRYRLSVFSTDGIADFNATVEASVRTSIIREPSDLLVTTGDNAVFSVEAAGSGPFTYQWRANGANIAGETDDTLTIFGAPRNLDGTRYSVVVRNGVGPATSRNAILSVNAPTVAGRFSQQADTLARVLSGPAPTLDFNDTEPGDAFGRVLLRINNLLLVGGDFTGTVRPSNGATNRTPFLAAINATTGQTVSRFEVPAQVNSVVRALALSPSGDQVYIGGDFGLLAVDAVNGELDFAVEVTEGGDEGRVFDIAVTQSEIYIGGDFSRVGNSSRANIARLSLDGDVDSSWSPQVTNGFESGRAAPVQSVTVSPNGNIVYVGGNFDFINGTPVALTPNGATVSMLTLNASNGNVRSERFAPFVGTNERAVVVHDIAVTDEYVIVAWGGPNFVSFHSPDGTRLQNYRGTGDVQSLQVVGDRVFVGHHGEFFGFVSNPIPAEAVVSRNPDVIQQFELHSFRLDGPSFTPDQAWPITGRFGVWGIAAAEDAIWVTGQFSRAGTNNVSVDGLVRFPALD